jgi:DNA repair protein RadA/Sms
VACTQALHHAAHEQGVTLLLLGHVTKDGDPAGPKAIEHLVDCALHVERTESGGVSWRGVRASKNRLGPTGAELFRVLPNGAWIDAASKPHSTSADV